MSTPDITARLEYLRQEIDAERISTGELIELQNLTEHIDPGDVQLLEAAGVPEFPVVHNVSVIEHGANRRILFVRCDCGWSHGGGVPKPVGWTTAQRLAAEHTAAMQH